MTDINKFYATSDIESYFVDKTTGFPLAGGIVTFYSDVERTTLKPVYELSGAPGSYTFVPIENPMILSSTGSYQDESGNNIVPYYYPFVGTPEDDSNEIELYYITVESSTFVPQFVRQAWPPQVTTTGVVAPIGIKNYIPNGQFLIYNDIVSPTNPPITIDSNNIAIQPIAQGGWSFRHVNGSTSIFKNQFNNVSQNPVSGLNDFPNAFFQYICQVFDPIDTVRDLTLVFPGVFTFSSDANNPLGPQNYTFSFSAQSLDVNIYTFDVRLIFNFGTGGAPTPQIDMDFQSVQIDSLDTFRLQNLVFPDNPAVLGTNGDDYVAIVIRGPASIAQAEFTNFSLVAGNYIVPIFPVETQAEVLSETIYGTVKKPATDGSELYLSPQYTLEGSQFNDDEIGDLVFKSNIKNFSGSISTKTNILFADGHSYFTEDFSPLGIPFSRLQSFLWDDVNYVPVTGTGINFVTSYIPSNPTDQIILSTNKRGAQTSAVDGSNPTGFTFSTLATGNNYGATAFVNNSTAASFYLYIDQGPVSNPTSGTSGFTINIIYNSSGVKPLFDVQIPSLPLAGTYFTFQNFTPTNYYVWFTIDGVGTDPAPGGTGILVPLLSTYSISDAATLIANTICGHQISNIVTTAASLLVGGENFQFTANSSTYPVYYIVDGVGSAPALPRPIKVDVLSTDTASQLALKTMIAINMFSFATPNYQDVFLKGAIFDKNELFKSFADERFSLTNIYGVSNSGLNTYQFSSNIQHTHANSVATVHKESTYSGINITFGEEGLSEDIPLNISYEGYEESKPFNCSIAVCIKY